ncbi:kinase-like domain-containing protein [Polychytrium aggregatum]|uniref:kinase-like domain-containing protein n=1 Tax=Polychytrium aggregatum TaxID=110093 RepID=UPI0022FF382F|nr:kinase-like domain-containing protein [Polychytrium aggregatum]KAI9197410.1 kinase-like domain-containing protein [Polychytrium aggregatum]
MEKRHRRGYSITAKKSIESVDSDDGPYNLKDSVSRKSLVSRPNNEPQDTGKKTIKRSRSESSMAEKYGKVDEVLGKGANATVRLAHLKETKKNSPTCPEKLYAIKEFRKRRKDETKKEYVKKLIAEFCISSSLHHPNVVETVDLLQDERNKWCVVMEYLSGGDLFARISVGGPITTEEANCFFKQLLSGVAYMHSMGVAHRDLKPENLLLDERCQILKITDFGVSTVFRTCFETKPRPVKGCCGSEPYIAPEEWEDEREYDPVKVDVWACAIIYYVMNSKMVPWRCSKASDPNYSIYLRQRPKSAQVVSGFPRFDQLQHQAQRKVLYRCLDPNPNTRDSISDILDDDYFRKTDMCIVAYDNHGECVALPPVRHTHTASKPH